MSFSTENPLEVPGFKFWLVSLVMPFLPFFWFSVFFFLFSHILPCWKFFTEFCCQRFLTKWIYLVLLLKKSQINPKTPFCQFKLTVAKGGYSLFFSLKKKEKTKCLGSNKNVNVVLFCVVVRSKPYLWHWKMYFTLILKFCLDYPIETKQENY